MLRVQREGETLDIAIRAMRKASAGKGSALRVVIATSSSVEQHYFLDTLYDDVQVVLSTALTLQKHLREVSVAAIHLKQKSWA